MRLVRARVNGVGPLLNLTFGFADTDDRPRSLTCVLGGAGTGKTSLLAAIAVTRPGYAVAITGTRGFAVTDWLLGDDEAARPHPLRIATPSALLENESEDHALLRRREQALYERRAAEAGFALVAVPACRWFSRSPVALSGPERSIMRHDVRAGTSFDDATRADVGRETKQILSYAAISAALSGPSRLFAALRAAVNALTGLVGYSWQGADAVSLEPLFQDPDGERALFAELPTSVRHLVALAALPVRAVAAAYPDRDPLDTEVVVLVDDVELHQEAATERVLPAALRKALPRAQWILTTSSPTLALGCEADEVVALRRTDRSGGVAIYTGPLAVMH